jgi:acyl carrier protein
MGLDSVELIMAIEDEFGVTIPAENAPQLAILGDMHAFIIRKLQQQGRNPDESEVWERLQTMVVKQLGVRPEEVTSEANLFTDLGAD